MGEENSRGDRMGIPERRYDIDWIRVLAVYLLIPFHTAVAFSHHGISYIKNDQTALFLSTFVGFVHQWHMPLLFLVSGAASWYSLKSRGGGRYLVDRVKRLLVPLVFGTLVIVPPMIYFQRLQEGRFSGSLLGFYPTFFNGVYPEGNFSWGHLWFLAYLFTFSLIALSLFLYLRGDRGKNYLDRVAGFCERRWGIFIFAVPFILVEVFLRAWWPGFQNLVNDWANFMLYITAFIYGYILASDERFAKSIDRYKVAALFMGVVTQIIVLTIYSMNIPWTMDDAGLWVFFMAVKGLNCWLWLMAILGLGHRFLSFTNKYLSYFNESALPVYIIHMLVVVAFGYFVVKTGLGVTTKYLIITGVSLILTTLLYDICVKRTRMTRFLFGMRPIKGAES
ncbi:MAG: acyltransferase [Deltaproteobacteria bacterium]|uniref:Acyltransferase n=1 Tax=Candidatus Zymogenus saltonus TaxID=2844893 RepID=A0A9D8PNQ0_9DELT|nr:acyltransferase [Candidatus Zymogenus saltonus]